MQRRDQIDPTLAKHFAWMFVRPGDTAQLTERLRAVEQAITAGAQRPAGEESKALVVSVADDGETERSRAKAKAACRALATAIADAWASTDPGGGDVPAALPLVKRLL